MYTAKLVGVYILLVTSVCVRCRSRIRTRDMPDWISRKLPEWNSRDVPEWNSRDVPEWNSRDVPARNCDTENKHTLAEIKSEIRNLKQLLDGLRQKLDPDFKLPPPYFSPQVVPSVKSAAQPVPSVEYIAQLAPSVKPIAQPIPLVKSIAQPVPSAELKCPPGFEYVDRASSCYKVVYELHSWTAARRRCHDLHPGAYLAVITNSDENIGLMAYLKPELAKNWRRVGSRFRRWFSGGTLLWTSGQRLNETSCTDEFVWKMADSTQLPLSFTYWDQNEPNCFQSELEGCLQLKSYREFKWNDGPCGDAVFPLCEYDPLLLEAPATGYISGRQPFFG